MGKTIHVHIHSTKDAGFEEGKHPRSDNGQFGAGGGNKQAHSSLGAGAGPGFNPGKAHKPESKGTAAKTFPVGSKVRLPNSQSFHEVVGHSGAGANAILQLKGGGFMEARKAMMQGASPKPQGSQGTPAANKKPESNQVSKPGGAAERVAAKGTPPANAQTKPVMSMHSLKEGDHLFDSKGQKVDEVESISKRALGNGWTIHTRAGHQVHVDASTGRNAQGWTNTKK